MRAKRLVVLGLAALVVIGCSADGLKAYKDDSWGHLSKALPDSQNSNPAGYGHPFRGPAFVLYPVGVALDWVLVKPFYLLAGLAPEWFGLTAEDAQRYHDHHPELVRPSSAPKRLE